LTWSTGAAASFKAARTLSSDLANRANELEKPSED
jgi:hypothetical protein